MVHEREELEEVLFFIFLSIFSEEQVQKFQCLLLLALFVFFI